MTSSRIRPSATSARERRAGRGDGDLRVVGGGQGLERGAAALQVQRRDPVDEHDVRAGRALERPAVVVAAARPRQRGAVRVGRIGRREQVRLGSAPPASPARGRRAVDRARRPARTGRPRARRRSSRAGSGPPPRAPAAPGRPRRSRPRSPPTRPPRGSATPCRSSSASAAAWSRSVGVAVAGGSTSDQRPAASGGPSAVSRPGRAAAIAAAAGPLPAQGTQRRERVVRDLAGPHQVPQRVEDLAVRAAAGRA